MVDKEKNQYWKCCGTVLERGQVVYFSQILLIYIIIITCIINLSLANGDSNLWTALLSSCIGYILPSPKIKISKESKKHIDESGISSITSIG